MARRRGFLAGNWKMNGLAASETELSALLALLGAHPLDLDIALCPPATLIARFAALARGHALKIGAQDCHTVASGAHTGDLSAAMLKDAGAALILCGHSERRADHHESDEQVRAKAAAAQKEGLLAVVCIGETLAAREAGRTLDVLARQIAGSVPDSANAANLVIAYEPVWAIGTGKTPAIDEIANAHAFIRQELTKRIGAEADATRLVYGGSVKPSNAAAIGALSDVDGALVGGASLKASEFFAIAQDM